MLVDVEPSGTALMEDFDAAGGLPTLLRALGDRLHGEVLLANGSTTSETQHLARTANGVVHDINDAVDAKGAFRVVRGNLAPDGALIKRSAATSELLSHRDLRTSSKVSTTSPSAPAPTLECPDNAVLVFGGAGTRWWTRHARVGHDPHSRATPRARDHRHGAGHGCAHEWHEFWHRVLARGAGSRTRRQ